MKQYSKDDLERMTRVTLKQTAREYLLTCDGADREQKTRILDEVFVRWDSCVDALLDPDKQADALLERSPYLE